MFNLIKSTQKGNLNFVSRQKIGVKINGVQYYISSIWDIDFIVLV